MPQPHDTGEPHAPIDAWLIPPDNPPQRVADKRRQPMRLSALFEEFLTFLRVEQEAAPRSIDTYRWCFRDFESFTMREVGGTVLVTPLHRRTVPGLPVRARRAWVAGQLRPRTAGDAREFRQVGGAERED